MAPEPVSVHEALLKEPVPLDVTVTVPEGVLARVPVAEPGDSSVTVILQVVRAPVTTELGLQ